MNLVKSRLGMRYAFGKGEKPGGLLEDYRENRMSEDWRTSFAVEELCEYILYLEEQLNESE